MATQSSNTNSTILDAYPILEGVVTGVVAFLAGLGGIFALIQLDSDFGDEFDQFVSNIEAIGGGTLEVVSWTFFNAQFVHTEWSETVDGEEQYSQSFDFLTNASTSLPEIVYTAVPLVLLLAAGFILVRWAGASTEGDAIKYGAMTVLGYLPLTMILLFVSRVSEEQNGHTELYAADVVGATVVAGLLLPGALGAIGGFLAFKQQHSETASSRSHSQPPRQPPRQKRPPQQHRPPRQNPPRQPPRENQPPQQQRQPPRSPEKRPPQQPQREQQEQSRNEGPSRR